MDNYDVGYGKPPKHTRFQKGISGNKKGRPPGRRNIATLLKEILDQQTVIVEKGVRRNVTKLEAALMKLVNRALSGDLVALRQMTALVRSHEEQATESAPKELSQSDLEIINRVLQRQEKGAKGGLDENH